MKPYIDIQCSTYRLLRRLYDKQSATPAQMCLSSDSTTICSSINAEDLLHR